MAFAYSTTTQVTSSWPAERLASLTEAEHHYVKPSQEQYPGELSFLRQQNSQLQHVIDVMPTAMVMLDGNGVVIKMNAMAQQLLDEPILGQPWYEVIKRSFKPRADDWHEVSLKDGRRVKLEITALGEQPGQLIMITDLTETRLLQDKLSQLQRLSSLGQMVSKLAHQIRTPLSAALLYGENLKSHNLSDTARDAFQEKLVSRLHDLEQQVNDMLLFAKSGQQAVVEPVDVNTLLEHAFTALEPQISQADAQVNIHSCEEHCQILGNMNALSGAIQNLIHNSLSVIKSGAVININAYCQNADVYISVQDNGEGIDAEMAEKIFEPFYTSRLQGTGLGLAVVKSVAQAHQGEVRLLSQAGEGAHFCLRFPKLTSDSLSSEQCSEHAKENNNDHN